MVTVNWLIYLWPSKKHLKSESSQQMMIWESSKENGITMWSSQNLIELEQMLGHWKQKMQEGLEPSQGRGVSQKPR